jgi:hypothetical protein
MTSISGPQIATIRGASAAGDELTGGRISLRKRERVRRKTPLFALQELAGWETERIVRRYVHLGAEHLLLEAKVDAICGAGRYERSADRVDT